MTNPPTPHELKPCPFCGEQRIYLSEGREGGINCPSCLARIPNECDDTEEMVACWNARAMDWDDPALVDEVALLLQDRSYEALHMTLDAEQAEDYAQAALQAILGRVG